MNKRKPPNSGSNIYKESSNKAPTSVIEYGELCYRHGYKDRDDEIIRCKDCKYNYGIANNCEYAKDDIVCCYWESDGLHSDDFCSKGKRRKSE